MDNLERIARALCLADFLDPDELEPVVRNQFQRQVATDLSPSQDTAPRWRSRVRHAQAVLAALGMER